MANRINDTGLHLADGDYSRAHHAPLPEPEPFPTDPTDSPPIGYVQFVAFLNPGSMKFTKNNQLEITLTIPATQVADALELRHLPSFLPVSIDVALARLNKDTGE